MVAMLALSVSGAGQGGVNDSTSTEGTGIASLSYADVVKENTEFEISVMLDEGNDIEVKSNGLHRSINTDLLASAKDRVN